MEVCYVILLQMGCCKFVLLLMNLGM